MQTIFHSSESRGQANLGWLKSYHSFSFADYHNAERMNFGALRVLNDDCVAPGMGFEEHFHSEMEIISIPLRGTLEHKDSIGNTAIIRSGEIQVMSAGTGIRHSEYNQSKNEDVEFLQIWVIPRKRGYSPRYDQIEISDLIQPDQWSEVLSPDPEAPGVWVNQDTWFSMGNFSANSRCDYTRRKSENGIYLFVIKGEVTINGQTLRTRDAAGILPGGEFDFQSTQPSQVLLMEVPML